MVMHLKPHADGASCKRRAADTCSRGSNPKGEDKEPKGGNA